MSVDADKASIDHISRPLDGLATLLIVSLCLFWGFNQVATKLALPDIPPLIQATIRSAGGALIVFGWARMRGASLSIRDGTLIPGIAAGIMFGIEFMLIYRGLLFTTASRAILFIFTAPFFVVLGARIFLPGDRFSPWQWLGLILSFAGVIAALGIPTPQAHPLEFLGDAMMLVAAALWAGTTLVVKASCLAQARFEKTLLYQLVVSAPILGLGALVFGERMVAAPSAMAVGSVAYQTAWVVGVTYLAWFSLVQRYSASRLSAFTFLTPLFGVAAGHLVLGEPLTGGFVGAVILVTLGLVLVNRPR